VPDFCEQRIKDSPSTLSGIVHGSLDGTSVLVDRVGRTWLVDFEQTGLGPLIRDFVSLETAIKFDMVAGADVEQRHELERRLLAMRYLGEDVDVEGLVPEGKKALQLIGQVRSQAADVVGSAMEPYLIGLLYCAAKRFLDYRPQLKYTREEVVTFTYALLSMAMLCQRLVQWKDQRRDLPLQAVESLWLDADNQEVWIEGRRVVLPPRRFRLLEYLYDHANQLCTRSAIARDVFDVELSGLPDPEVELMEKDHITTNISRLRRDIEPDPSRPKYILTVRARGYRLELKGDFPIS
jgi:DNA-binding winged helix-turn-helix (wHTH) protein